VHSLLPYYITLTVATPSVLHSLCHDAQRMRLMRGVGRMEHMRAWTFPMPRKNPRSYLLTQSIDTEPPEEDSSIVITLHLSTSPSSSLGGECAG
jgi:hypothetical protein